LKTVTYYADFEDMVMRQLPALSERQIARPEVKPSPLYSHFH